MRKSSVSNSRFKCMEKMICPNYEEFQSDPKVSIYKKLNKYISLHNVQFVLSSTVFSLESIRKGERQSFFSNYTPDIRITDDWNEKTHEMHLEISIGPNDSSFPVLAYGGIKRPRVRN